MRWRCLPAKSLALILVACTGCVFVPIDDVTDSPSMALDDGASGTRSGSSMPVPFDGAGWDFVSAGTLHACGLRSGALWCWGSGSDGELGIGSDTSQRAPVRVGEEEGWQTVSAGFGTTCGILRTELYCWGETEYGAVGVSKSGPNAMAPARVGTAAGWEAVSTSSRHTCGIREGSMYCWGDNTIGELGVGTREDSIVPQRVGIAEDWDSLSTALRVTYGIHTGALYAWGYRDPDVGVAQMPERVGSEVGWTAVAAATGHVCGIRQGYLFCWGHNDVGQLGDGTQADRVHPIQIGTHNDWQSIDTGGDEEDGHSCGVATGGLHCWATTRRANWVMARTRSRSRHVRSRCSAIGSLWPSGTTIRVMVCEPESYTSGVGGPSSWSAGNSDAFGSSAFTFSSVPLHETSCMDGAPIAGMSATPGDF